jgi:hypothetical protein
MLGLNFEEVQSGEHLQVDPSLTQGLEQRIESVARDMLQGKESSTMTGYMPIMQKALAWAWHKQQQQQQEERQQRAGSEPATTAATAAAAASAEPPDSDAPGDSTVQSPFSSLLMNVRTFLDFITAAERPSEAMRQDFARVLSGGSREGESLGGSSSSRAPQSQAQPADDLASVQELRQLLNGGPVEVNLHEGRFSLGNWKKYLNALTYLQEKQQHILLGKTRGTSIWWQRQLWIPPASAHNAQAEAAHRQ